MSALGSFQVSVALVTVQMTVPNGVILEATIPQASNNEESFLCRLLCLELKFLHTTLVMKFGFDSAHFEAEVGGWHLS